jgi:hypothetical protein
MKNEKVINYSLLNVVWQKNSSEIQSKKKMIAIIYFEASEA